MDGFFQKQTSFKGLFWFFCIIAVSLITIIAIVPNNDTVSINNEQTQPFNTGWTLENENRSIELPCIVELRENDTVTIARVLPESLRNSVVTLSFISSLQSVRIEVDGGVIYEYAQNPDAYFDVQPPPAWHVVRLSPDLMGKPIRISYSSPYQKFAGVLNGIEMGSKYANVSTFVGGRLLSIALAFTIFTFGVFAIIICLFARRRIPELDRLLYLGIASVLIALWSACETKAMQIFTENVQLIMFVTFLSIMLFPIALLLFFREGFSGRTRKAYNGLITAFAAYFAGNVLLQVLNLASFNDYFFLLLLLIAAMLALIFSSTVRAYMKNRTVQLRIPVIAVTFLLVFSLVDMYRFLFGQLSLTSSEDTSLYARIGILLMIFTLGYASVRQVLVYYAESSKAEVYKLLAETDPLSGLKNRTYLTGVLPGVFAATARKEQPFSAIMVDIDNFKSYNDHYGHSAGDEVIRLVAKALQSAVKNVGGEAVRYGGEEFLLILPLNNRKEAVEAAERVEHALAALEIPHGHSAVARVVTVSQGIYSAIPGEADSVEEFIEFADRALYQRKRNGKNGYAVYEAC